MFFLGLAVGIFTGGFLGVAIMALMNAVGRESRLEEDRELSTAHFESGNCSEGIKTDSRIAESTPEV